MIFRRGFTRRNADLAGSPNPRLSALIRGGILAVLFATALHAEPPPPPDPIRISFGSIVPEGTPWADELVEIKGRLERDGGGRVKVSLFLGGRRGSENDMLAEVRRGKLQAVAISTGALAAEVPELQCLEFPYLLRTPGEVDAVLDGPIGQKLVKKAEEKGLVLATWGENGWRSIATRAKPVRTPDDLKDVRVRAQESRINVAFWNALGAAPTQIALPDVMTALKTTVIDGFDQTPVYMTAAGWHTEIQHFALTEHSYQGGVIVYNKRFLDGLPEDLRRIVLTDAEVQGRRNRANVRKLAVEIVRELEASGLEVHRPAERELEAFRERTKVVYGQFKDTEVGALVAEIQAFLAARRAARGPADRGN